MKTLFYLDEFEFYGGMATPIKIECDGKRGCVAIYDMKMGMRNCHARVYVSKKGTRKVLDLCDNGSDTGGSDAIFDIMIHRMDLDGDNFEIPGYEHSIAFKRIMYKTIWKVLMLICIFIGGIVTLKTYFFGNISIYTFIALAIFGAGLAGLVNSYRIDDLMSDKNDDYEKLKIE